LNEELDVELKVYPVKFEAYQDGEQLFTVEAFDSSTATVSVDSLMTVELWDEVAAKVRECIVAMELDTTTNAEITGG